MDINSISDYDRESIENEFNYSVPENYSRKAETEKQKNGGETDRPECLKKEKKYCPSRTF